jgi:hypothetical protein
VTRRRALCDPSSLVITLPRPPAAIHLIHKSGLADLEWASEQSAWLYRTRQARHQDVVREGEQPLGQRQPTFSCCG